jgi:hypothetical protein
VAQSETPATPAGDLRDLEVELDLVRHRLDGWSVWPLFRCDAFQALTTSGQSSAQAPRVMISRFHRLALAARDLATLAFRAPRGKPVIVSGTSYLVDRDEAGRRKDWLFDDVCKAIGDCVKIERVSDPLSLSWRREAAVQGLLTDALPVAFGPLLVGRLRPSADVMAAAQALARDLAKVPAWRRFTVREIANRLTAFRRTTRIWIAILRRLAPPYLMIEDGYFNHALVAAARSLRIPVLELQHGLFFARGPEYDWPASAAAHRDAMPLPDRLLVFGDHAAGILEREGFWRDRCVAVGSARMDERRQARPSAEKPSGEVWLVITAQGVNKAELVAWIADLSREAADWAQLRIILKLHPAADYPKADYLADLPADPRLTVLSGRESPSTIELLKQADFHASVFSTCHYEAVSLGVRTFVLPLPGHEEMRPMIEAGHAGLAPSPGEMIAMMRKGGDHPSPGTAHHYYAEGAVPNILREIDALTGGGRP